MANIDVERHYRPEYDARDISFRVARRQVPGQSVLAPRVQSLAFHFVRGTEHSPVQEQGQLA